MNSEKVQPIKKFYGIGGEERTATGKRVEIPTPALL